MLRQSSLKYFLENSLKHSLMKTYFISYHENLFIAVCTLSNFSKVIDSLKSLTTVLLIKKLQSVFYCNSQDLFTNCLF